MPPHAQPQQFFAHPGHLLIEHLKAVSERAAIFAAAFGSGEWGKLAGLWHDLGKFQPEFQRRLAGEPISVEHSGIGAAYAMRRVPRNGVPLAFVIAGHHAGLANRYRDEANAPRSFERRLQENQTLLEESVPLVPPEILGDGIPPFPSFLNIPPGSPADLNRKVEFWTRFLFSALTDADYLDTEAAMDPARSARRPAPHPIEGLVDLIDNEVHRRSAAAPLNSLNKARRDVAEACRRAAEHAPGLFSLTAPTGSGKTLAGMLFALHHAKQNGLRRVIVVLPYTSIIEQNASVYRQVFGDAVVLEHHSNLDPETEIERSGEEITSRHRLAAENWDIPLVVTTSVQFFESLFSNRPSRCRKLHNIARSVIILDEVQSLPPGLLIPILDALKNLASDYGCSILLSTATPPALVARDGAPWGLPEVTEIIPDASALFRALRRVRFEWPVGNEVVPWEELARRIAEHRQALAVVHLRNDARLLAQLLQQSGPAARVFHLSAAMCPAHRSKVLEEVRAALAAGEACRLASTQLIEAGVDIDFPVVFRAMAGLDSIVQAAGRCNREGSLHEGLVRVFNAPTDPPKGVLRQGLSAMKVLLGAKGDDLDVSDPITCLDYSRLLYSTAVRDHLGIQAERAALNFATVAAKFRLIEDQATETIVVPYDDRAIGHIENVRREGPSRDVLRPLQPYTVRIYQKAFQDLQDMGALEQLAPGLHALLPHYGHLYDHSFGLQTDDTSLALLFA